MTRVERAVEISWPDASGSEAGLGEKDRKADPGGDPGGPRHLSDQPPERFEPGIRGA